MKKAFAALSTIFCIVVLCGCAKTPVSEKIMAEDMAEYLQPSAPDMIEVNNIEIVKRRTDTSNHLDTVYIQIDYNAANANFVSGYKLEYGLYNEGWILDNVEEDYSLEWSSHPISAISDSALLSYYIPENATIVSNEADLEYGSQHVEYTYTESHPYCDIHVYANQDFFFSYDHWYSGGGEMVESRTEEWKGLEGNWRGSWNGYGAQSGNVMLTIDGYDGYSLTGDVTVDAARNGVMIDEPSVVQYSYGGRFEDVFNYYGQSYYDGTTPLTGEIYRSNQQDGSLLCLNMDTGLTFCWFGYQCFTLEKDENVNSGESVSADSGNASDISYELSENTCSASASDPDGFAGPVRVTVSADENGVIKEIETEHNETAGLGKTAIEDMSAQLEGTVPEDIDAVSGATLTSDAYLSALKDAYIVACAGAKGLTQYDGDDPICGIWRCDSNDTELYQTLWALYPDASADICFTDTDGGDIVEAVMFVRARYSYNDQSGTLELETIMEGDSLMAIPIAWDGNDAFSFTDGNGQYKFTRIIL